MKCMMKVAFAFLAVLALAAGSATVKAQTVVLNGLGSSGLFLELGLGANDASGLINAPCVWSENTNTVAANDDSTSGVATLTDKGSAWVAWTTGGGTCAAPGTTAKVYTYLSTDSVVGNRCLYNSNLSTRECWLSFPTTAATPAGLILPTTGTCGSTGECTLPTSIELVLNSSSLKVNYAGTDIRPEDAEFAIQRAHANCGSVITGSTQYLGLGYAYGSQIKSGITGSTSTFNVINFTLPSFYVTSVGATPIVVAVNDNSGTGLAHYTNITSQTLADFLDGTYSYTGQVASPTGTGSPVTVYIREPLSGTYNTMEFNVPNRIGTLTGTRTYGTSQDVGYNQTIANQRNCTVTSPWPVPSTTTSTVANGGLMDIETASTGHRIRAIGTGQELSSVVGNLSNSIGYAFWSAANFAPFSAVTSSAKYYTVDSVDPLGKSGIIPTTPSEISGVSLSTTADGKYPIWSMLRLVNVGTTQNAAVNDLALAAQTYANPSHPDFVTLANMLVVRSHFNPPSQSVTLSNGSGGTGRATTCSTTETGGDVGGTIAGLNVAALSQSPLTVSEESYCTSTSTAGQTGHRR